jgi:mRNA interferase MazF
VMTWSPQPRAALTFGTTLSTTRTGMRPRQGDIVLIPIPFTDLSSRKRRPVIVISNDAYNQKTADIVVAAMTSNPISVDYSFTITSADLETGTLNRPGKVRVDKIYTLSQSIIVQTFGRVKISVLDQIRKVLNDLIARKPQISAHW